MNRLKGVIFILLLLESLAFCREVSFNEAKEILLKNNIEIKQAESKVIQAKYKQLEATAPWMPKFSTSFRNTLLSRPQLDLSHLPPQQRLLFGASFPPNLTSDKLYTLNFTISELLPLDKFFYSYQMASASYEIAKNDYERTTRDVSIKFKESFVRALVAKKSLEVIEMAVQISSENYRVSEKLYNEGRVSYLDFSSAKINYLTSQLNLLKAQNGYKLAKEQLRTILCVDFEVEPKGELEDFLDDPAAKEKSIDFDKLKRNIQYLPEMKALELQKKILKNNLYMARSEVFPSISVYGSYDWTVEDYKKPLDEWDDRYSWYITLSWPLFNGGSTFSKCKQAEEGMKQIELLKKQVEDGLLLELDSLFSTYLQLVNSLSVVKETVSVAKDNYEVAKNYYLEGRSSYLELLQAELNYSNTKINYYQTLSEYIITCEKLKKYY